MAYYAARRLPLLAFGERKSRLPLNKIKHLDPLPDILGYTTPPGYTTGLHQLPENGVAGRVEVRPYGQGPSENSSTSTHASFRKHWVT